MTCGSVSSPGALVRQRNQSLSNRKRSEARNAVNVELAHDALAMGFHGADAQVEFDRDFLIAQTFSDEDKDYLRELYESDVKIILLTKHLLEMDYFDLLKYKSDKHPGRSKTIPDWLMRLTIINNLGDDFAKKHHLWI